MPIELRVARFKAGFAFPHVPSVVIAWVKTVMPSSEFSGLLSKKKKKNCFGMMSDCRQHIS